MSVELSEGARRVLDAKSYATVATLNPNGGPQTSVVWVLRDGDAVLFSTTRQRQKGRNLARDPRISMTIMDPGNPLEYIELRGRAEVTDDTDHELENALFQKYMGEDAPPPEPGVQRVRVRVVPDKATGSLA
jgi:PPOX class probable F420-dependent enzyme